MFVIKSISIFLEGKEAMRKGMESFNKAVSSSYKNAGQVFPESKSLEREPKCQISYLKYLQIIM